MYPRLFFLAATLLSFNAAHAAGPYDGEWKGTAVTRPPCNMGEIALSVADNKVSGEARFPRGTPHIAGVVADDGKFDGSVGHWRFTGIFKDDAFSGSFSTVGRCDMTVTLTRAK